MVSRERESLLHIARLRVASHKDLFGFPHERKLPNGALSDPSNDYDFGPIVQLRYKKTGPENFFALKLW